MNKRLLALAGGIILAPLGYSSSGSWFGGRTTWIYADAGTTVYPQSDGSASGGAGVWSGYLLDASQ